MVVPGGGVRNRCPGQRWEGANIRAWQERPHAGFWLEGQCPLLPEAKKILKIRKLDYEMVHSEVYLNKHVVSIAPFCTPVCPDCSQNIT